MIVWHSLNNNIYRGQSKAAMQQLYKQQLDSLMQSKAKQREEEKNR